MKIHTSTLLAILCIGMAGFTACEKIDIPRADQTDSYNQVYMAAAARNPNRFTFKMADSNYTITYGASYGGYGTSGQDIEIQFAVDEQKAQAYNTANGTSYPMLPASAYTITQPDAVLAKGAVSTTPLAIKINPAKGMEVFKDYILAISISSVKNNVKVNESLRTAYYIVRGSYDLADFTDFDRSSWTILGVSSQEPAEGDNGGLGLHTIDNNPATFWHTAYDGGLAPPPHWLAVDMGATKELHGLSFMGRQSTNNGKPNTVQVEVSTNAADWSAAATLTLQNINAVQKFFIPGFPQARYVRITVVTNFGNTGYTHLAELGAF